MLLLFFKLSFVFIKYSLLYVFLCHVTYCVLLTENIFRKHSLNCSTKLCFVFVHMLYC